MTVRIPSEAEIRGGDRGYLAYHAPRYRFLLEVASRHLLRADARVLEIGPSPLGPLLAATLGCRVDSLGLEPEGDAVHGHHFHFDLDGCPGTPGPQGMPRYDLVVFAEVIEHLHTSPVHTLAFVRGLLADAGVLILQTPNAASLPKRLKLLAGRNPYELIRADGGNPGHFREYTLSELRDFARQTGLEVVEVARRFYFDARFAHHGEGGIRPQPIVGAIKNGMYRALPRFLREGVTLVLRRAPGA